MSLDTIIAELQELNTHLKALQVGGVSTKRGTTGKAKRTMSAEAREKISKAAKARWAKQKKS
jgi:hypothetical protein